MEQLLADRCGGCHNEEIETSDLDLSSSDVAARVANVPSASCAGFILANPQDPMQSLLYRKVSGGPTGCGEPMPPAPIVALSEAELRALRDWIAGLPPPAPDAFCTPREERTCEGVGNRDFWPDESQTGSALEAELSKICSAPVQSCSADGSEWSECSGIFPSVEDCTTPEDEDCNLETPAEGCQSDAWAFSVVGTKNQWADSLDVDADGNTYVLGTFEGEVDVGSGVFASDEPGGQFKHNVFFAKYDAAGTHLWSRNFGDTSNQYATRIVVDPETGDSALLLRLFGSVDFGSDAPVHTQSGSGDFVIGLFDAGGEPLWSQRFGGDANDRAERVAFSRLDGDVLLAGKTGTAAEEPLVIPSKGPVAPLGLADGLVVKLDRASGDVEWHALLGGRECPADGSAESCTGSDDDYAFGIDSDAEGDVYVAGRFEGYFDFANLDGEELTTELESLGAHDIFVVKLDGATGSPVWSRRFGGAGDDRAYDVAWQAGTGNVVVTGFFTGNMDAGGTELEAVGGEADDDFLVMALGASDGATVWARGYGDATSQFGVDHDLGRTTRSTSLAIDAEDSLYLGGPLYGSWDGRLAARAGSSSKPDLFLVRLSPEGDYLGGRVHGGTGSELAYDIALDPSNDGVLLAGRFYGRTLDLGSAGSLLGLDGSELSSVFVAKWPRP